MYVGKVVSFAPEKGIAFITGVGGNAFVAFSIIGKDAYEILKSAHSTGTEVSYEARLGPNKHGVDQWVVTKVIGIVPQVSFDSFQLVLLSKLDAVIGLLQKIHSQYEEER
jgi:cold shock CspA family protein